MHRRLLALITAGFVSSGCGGSQPTAPPPAPAAPFSVVETDIAALQQALQSGRVTSRQLTERYLERIATYEDRLNAIITVNAEGARRGRRDGQRTRRRPGARAAARHPDCAQGQHPHHRHPHHRRGAGVPRSDSALRRHADQEPARRRRDHHRQDRAHRAGALDRRGADADGRQLHRRGRLRLQPVRPADGPARRDVRRPPGAADRRVELRRRHRGQLLGGQRRIRHRRVDHQPVERQHAGRHPADDRPHQPLRRDSRSPPTTTPPVRWRARCATPRC